MIFRSSLIAALSVAAALTAAAARAQETEQPPAVHVVVEGETLWDLAARYLGDPLLWPEIYRLNTTVVEDPHWIFPGEELRFGSVEAAAPAPAPQPGAEERPQAVPAEPAQQAEPAQPDEPVGPPEVLPPPTAPPPPASANAPTVFVKPRPGLASALGSEAYRKFAVRRYEFYSSGFLTEDQALPWSEVLGVVGEERLRNIPASSVAGMFDHVAVAAPAGGTYQIGDSLLLASLTRAIPGWGEVAHPSGIGRVTEVTAGGAVIQIVAQFDRITDGQMALPIEAYADPGNVTAVPVEGGMMGTIIEPRLTNPVPGQQQVVFIDQGREAGVSPGDIFAVLKADEETGMAARTIAYLRVVHTRDRSATALIINIIDLGIQAGAPVQLVGKMP